MSANVMHATATAASRKERPSASRIRYEFLDGLRGCAALYVVLYHIYTRIAQRSAHGGGVPGWFRLTSYGHVAVDIFIVLSGYCLALPVISGRVKQVQSGIGQFIKRRAWRLLPPYYAALVLSIILLFVGSRSSSVNRLSSDLSPGAVLSHLALVHNFFPRYVTAINVPMWSIATEWQIYFCFPLLLLPLWRRFGNVATIGFGLAVGVLLARMVPGLSESCPWYLGLFAIGMTAAAVSASDTEYYSRIRERFSWKWLCAGLFAAFFIADACRGPWFITSRVVSDQYTWLTDAMVGLATACLLIQCSLDRLSLSQRRPLLVRFLQSRMCVSLGRFSYSLYLIHSPVLALVWFVVVKRAHGPVQLLAAMLAIGLPVVLGMAYLFYLAFEKPFINRREKRMSALETLDAAGPDAPGTMVPTWLPDTAPALKIARNV